MLGVFLPRDPRREMVERAGMRLAATILALLCVAGGYRRQVVLHGTPFPSTLVVLVDNSGSMAESPYACAIRQAMWAADQAGDGARVRFATFGSELVWQERPAIRGTEPTRTNAAGVVVAADPWIKLPDAEALAISRAWLQAQGTGGSTALANAVEAALSLKESPLGLIVVSDCEPDGGHEATLARIEKTNAARRGGPATIGVISVAPGRDAKKFALLVAEAAGGPVVELEAKK